MKFYKFTFPLILLFSFSAGAFAQTQIGATFSVKPDVLSKQSSVESFHAKTSFGYGIMMRNQFKSKLYLSSDLTIQKIDWLIPLGEGESDGHYYTNGKSLRLSSSLGWFVLNTQKIKLGSAIGLNVDYINTTLVQNLIYYEVIECDFCGMPVIEPLRYDAEYFTSSIKVSLDLAYQVSNKIQLNLRPNWTQFLHFKEVERFDRNLGLDFSLLYWLESRAKS